MRRYPAATPLYILGLLVFAAALWAWKTPIDITVTAVGVVRPDGEVVRVAAEAGGTIRHLHLKEGAHVRQGDVLIQLDTREVELRKRSIETRIHSTELRLADLDRRIADTRAIEEYAAAAEAIDTDADDRAAHAGMHQAKSRFDRAAQLHAAGLISRQSLEESRTAMAQAETEILRLGSRSITLKNAQREARLRDLASDAVPLRADLDSLYSQLAQVQLEQDQLTIVSPADGQITSASNLHVAEILSVGTTIAAIAPKQHSVVVEAWLPTADRRFVATGQAVRLRTDSFPPDEYDLIDGAVRSISPDAVFNESRLGAYRILITPAPDAVPLRLGMTFQVRFISRQEPLLWLLFQRIRTEMRH
jgi:hemolysin D